ncbi:MAG: hypothetical protein RLY16_721 [Bacteroidota bacterium]
MINKINTILIGSLFVVLIIISSACEKTAIEFGSEGNVADPNITMIDTFSVELSTLQIDSFLTNSMSQFIIGSAIDEAIGKEQVKSYFEVTAPELDLRNCNNCIFDSIVLHLNASGGFSGDTTTPYTIHLNELTQQLSDDEISTGYNTSEPLMNNSPMVSKTFSIRPSRKDQLQIRMPDEFGKRLFRMFKTNSDTITNNDRFKLFVKGFCLQTDPANKAYYYFNKSTNDSIIQLYYTVAGATPESKSVYFKISSDDQQFNSFSYDKSNSLAAGFTPKRTQLISSKSTGNTALLHFNSGLFPKIKFNNLVNIKELHPYVQVMRAELLIKPIKGSYGYGTAFNLPTDLELRQTDDQNYIGGSALINPYSSTGALQTGSLYIDQLYGENTVYTYDVTEFVNTVISEGTFSRKALILHPANANALNSNQRLLIHDYLAEHPIQLKLYILGL